MTTITSWLDVEVSDDIKLNTLSTNLAMVDLDNDNDFKLIVGDFGRGEEKPQVKVFRGTIPIADFTLPDLPLGAVGMYTSDTSPKSIPAVAVGFGSCIYIYRNLKIFYKYQVPRVEICGEELEVWKQLIDPSNHIAEKVEALVEKLKTIPAATLSSQSKQFLLTESNEQLEYLEQNPKIPVSKPTELTCMTTIKMHSVDKYSASCLVVATEDGNIIILDPQTFTAKRQERRKMDSPNAHEQTFCKRFGICYGSNYIICAEAKICELKKTPFLIVATGLFIVDYRITIATREKSVCLLKREWKQGRVLFNTDEHIIAIEVMTADNSIFVICTDNTMACYSKKGMKQWCISLDHRPVAMTLLPILHLGMTMVGVALASGHVQFYDGKALVDTLFVRDVVSVIKFGRLGREDHMLIIVTANGNLVLKILKRSAEFNTQAAALETSSATVPLQGKPWLIPKKSKLFLEQSTRERENAVEMHRSFQEELNRLRLSAAQTLLDAYTRSDNSVGVGDLEPIRLSAEVEGLGPVFRMTLLVENTSKDKAVVGLSILFHLHNTSYKVYNPYIKIPLLSPGSLLKFPTKIEEIFLDKLNPDVLFRTVTGQGGERTLVKILLLKSGRQTPVLAATVQMPPTDPLMLPLDKVDDLENFA